MSKNKNYAVPSKTKELISENVISLKERATGVSKDMDEILNPEADLIQRGSDEHLEVKTLGNLKGRDSETGLSLEDSLRLRVEKSSNFVSQFIRGPIGKRLSEIDEAEFLKDNVPVLDKSLDLFIDDVVSGGSFAKEEAFTQRFTFHNVDNNASITDQLCNAKLSADDPKSLFNRVKAFFDIDREAKKLACGHGYAMAVVYEHRDIANEIYKKYVLKEIKRKTKKNIESGSEGGKLNTRIVSMIASAEGASMLNREFKTRLKSGDDIVGRIDNYYLDILPPELFEIKHETYGDGTPMDDRAETLQEFTNRYFEQGLSENADMLEPGVGAESGVERSQDSMFYQRRFRKFEYSSVIDDASSDIRNAVVAMFSDMDAVSALQVGAESALNSMGVIQKNLISKLSYEELYMMVDKYERKEELLGEHEVTTGSESGITRRFTSAEHRTMNDILAGITVNSAIAMGEAGYLSKEFVDDILNATITETNSAFTNLFTENRKVIAGGEGIVTQTSVTKEEVASYRKVNKASNMFKGLKGDTTVVLDNSRAIPIKDGDTLYGVIHIDYSEYDSKELMYLRTMMGSSSLVGDGPVDDPEAKFATMAFKDTVVETLKRNLSANFIKNNSDVIYSVWKIFEDYDNMTKVTASNDATYMPMAKVRFIPADKIVMYVNGYGMGTAKYTKAAPYAHYYLLATECYMMHTVIDGKGTRSIQFNKGVDGNNDETLANVMSQLQQLAPTRKEFRNMMRSDMALGIRNLAWINGSGGNRPVEITYDEPPRDYGIDLDFLDKLELKATDALGYPSTLFATETKNGELATKLHAMDGAKVLDIVKTQKFFRLPSSQLATKMLRARLGNDSIYAVYNPPTPRKLNDLNKKEMLEDVLTLYDSLMDRMEANLEDEPEVLSHVRTKIFDYLLSDFSDYKEIKRIEESVRLDTILKEASESSTTKKKKKDDEDSEEDVW